MDILAFSQFEIHFRSCWVLVWSTAIHKHIDFSVVIEANILKVAEHFSYSNHANSFAIPYHGIAVSSEYRNDAIWADFRNYGLRFRVAVLIYSHNKKSYVINLSRILYMVIGQLVIYALNHLLVSIDAYD